MKCEVFATMKSNCRPCGKLRHTLIVSARRPPDRKIISKSTLSPSKLRPMVSALKASLRCEKKKKKRKETKLQRYTTKISELLQDLKKANAVKLDEAIERSQLPDNMKISFKAALRLTKAKSSKGNRYESNWLLHCLLLHIKSPKAYKHLRDTELMPLPHPSTLRRVLSGLPIQYGFAEFVFKALEEEVKGLPPQQRMGVLVFDEVKLREGIEYDRNNLHLFGFTDFGQFTEEYEERGGRDKLADHALVFMFRSLTSKRVNLCCYLFLN